MDERSWVYYYRSPLEHMHQPAILLTSVFPFHLGTSLGALKNNDSEWPILSDTF